VDRRGPPGARLDSPPSPSVAKRAYLVNAGTALELVRRDGSTVGGTALSRRVVWK